MERKGGDVAIQLLDKLRSEGGEWELTIVGPVDVPAAPRQTPGLNVVGNLDKSDSSESTRLNQVWSEANFFVLPTRADCAPIVLNEAAAYGLPVVSTDVGGNASIVRAEINGRLFTLAEFLTDASKWLREVWSDKERYRALRKSSRQAYEERLSWMVNAGRMVALIKMELE